MRRSAIAVSWVALSVSVSTGRAQSPRDTLAIEHATVLPMNRDTALVDHTVLVWQDRIVWIGPASDARIPVRVRRVDGRGAYVIPGLADMHVHLDSVQELAQFVGAGITTVRNMRGEPKHLAWRRRVASGSIAGPTIFTSGPSIGRGRFSRDRRFASVRSAADAEALVREQAAAGYDMIKVLRRISVPVYQRLLDAARAAQIPVVGHVVSEVGLARTLAAGQVSLEHADGLRDQSRIGSLRGDDGHDADADARAIARAGAWVGTIVSDRSGECAPPTPIMRRNIAALRRAGVKLLAGSDAGIGPIRPGEGLLCELATLVSAGLTPYEALASATVNAGMFAKLHLKKQPVPFGTVTPGARADLLVLRADPRTDLRALARPAQIVVRGTLLRR